MKSQSKRNHSDLSDSSATSPAIRQPTKSSKMSLDTYFTREASKPPNADALDFDEVLEDQAKSMSMEEKIDSMYRMMRAQEIKTSLDVSTLQLENKQLQLKLQQSDGIIAKLASKVSVLEDKIVSMETHALKKNMVIYNLPEKSGENVGDEVKLFLTTVMKVPELLIFSKNNVEADIRIDVAHRMGKKGNKPRPIIVSFTTQQGKITAMSYSKNLKASPYAISEQLPASVRERRTAQIPLMTKMRQEAQKNNSSANIKLVKDKLFVNNQLIKGKFESNCLDHITTSDAIDYNHIEHTLPRTVKNSVFQGHYHSVHTQMEASQVLRSCYQGDTAKSDHIIYAYRFLDENGQTVSGHDDDGEWSASQILMELLQDKGINDGILIVTRKHGGQNLGKQRFDIIRQVAHEALPMD